MSLEWSKEEHEEFFNFAKSYTLTEKEMAEVLEKKKNQMEIKLRIFCFLKIKSIQEKTLATVQNKIDAMSMHDHLKDLFTRNFGLFVTNGLGVKTTQVMKEMGMKESEFECCAVHLHSNVINDGSLWVEFVDAKEKMRTPVDRSISDETDVDRQIATILNGMADFVAGVYLRVNDSLISKYRCHFL